MKRRSEKNSANTLSKKPEIDIDLTGVGQNAPRPAPRKTQGATRANAGTARGGGASARKSTAQTQQRAPAKQRKPLPAGTTHKQARARRKRKRLIQGGLLAVFLVAGLVLSLTVLFPISDFRVEGETSYSTAEIIAAFGHETGENIFRFRISSTEEEMALKLPYLETLKVRRRLPGTVVFIVTPAQETYYALLEDTGVVLSQDMKVLRLCAERPAGLCLFEGITASDYTVGKTITFANEETQQTVKALLSAFEEAGLENVTGIDVSNAIEIAFTYDSRVRVNLGTVSELAYKVVFAKEVLNTKIGAAETGVLDASYPGKTIFSAS